MKDSLLRRPSRPHAMKAHPCVLHNPIKCTRRSNDIQLQCLGPTRAPARPCTMDVLRLFLALNLCPLEAALNPFGAGVKDRISTGM